MSGLSRAFAGHPVRLGGSLVGLAIFAVIAWYLGSPLFVRTHSNEALPAVPAAPAAATAQPSAPTAAPVAGTAPRALATGQLGYVDAIHNGKGTVRIVELGSQRFVRFEDVSITNAPDIHVYLSTESGGKWAEATSLYLGALKATDGSYNYEVPAGADLASYKSVVVWCRAFRVLITWADLT